MTDTTKPPNESAFPTPIDGRPGAYPAESGMTLRDYFAAKAIQGMCASFSNFLKTDLASFAQAMPTTAYEIADAMLKARLK